MRQDEDGTWWFRQSWLSDFMMCPERARREAFEPTHDPLDGDTDATVLGTAVHLAIENCLNGFGSYDWPESQEIGYDWLNQRWVDGDFHNLGETNRSRSTQLYMAMSSAWHRDIQPKLPLMPGTAEFAFKTRINTEYGIEGTMDYVDGDGVIWDWKTAGGLWYQQYGEKALGKKVQATVYTYADWLMRDHAEIPKPLNRQFNYGIMTKKNDSEGHIRTTVRTPQHWRFLNQQIERILELYHAFGPHKPWPLIDDDWHCSPQWCQHWATCKGDMVQL